MPIIFCPKKDVGDALMIMMCIMTTEATTTKAMLNYY